MRKILTILIGVLGIAGFAPGSLPLKEWSTNLQTPYILYISGDGGLNIFSNDLCTALNKTGYGITAVNAESYFQDKKTPAQATNDIVSYLDEVFKKRNNQQLILAGYSFGAGIVPFIANRLPGPLKEKLIGVVLISPPLSTDFEIHWLDMLGWNKKRSMDVVAEINALHVGTAVTIFGSDEKEFPAGKIKLKNYTNEFLPGGHHFEGNTGELAKVMTRYLK